MGQPVTKRKVCIVGYSPKSREDAPFGDDSFEFWGLNNLYTVLPGKKWDRWFDMHGPGLIEANNANLTDDHVDWLKQKHPFDIYMLKKYPSFPSSVEFPIAEIQARMVPDWGFEPGEEGLFHSGVAYPFAQALYEGVDEIHLYGIDMTLDEEYGYQQPNMTMWIGLARNLPALNGGKVRVVIGENCAIMKGNGLYGYDSEQYAYPLRMERFFFEDRDIWKEKIDGVLAEIAELQKQVGEKKKELNTYDGCRQYAERMRMKCRRARLGEPI